jgi:hypothetical protein
MSGTIDEIGESLRGLILGRLRWVLVVTYFGGTGRSEWEE